MMQRTLTLGMALLFLLASLAVASAPAPGKLTGGERYAIPDWFKESFLELADDAAEAAEADKHVMLFMHLDGCPYCAAVMNESIVGSDYSPWLRERFDAIAINVRGAREVVFNEQLTVTERELSRALKVRQTPAVIFLSGENKVVARIDGYRTAREFKRVLDYVDSKSYLKEDLAGFVARTESKAHYAFRDHPAFRDVTDLSKVEGPLLVLFEDAWCDACDLQHDTLMKDKEVNELLALYTVVRLDAGSDTPLVDPQGRTISPRAWTRELDLSARPSILLYGGGKQQMLIKGVLRHFHFTEALRYVGERRFTESASFREYTRARRAALLEAGVSIDLGRQ